MTQLDSLLARNAASTHSRIRVQSAAVWSGNPHFGSNPFSTALDIAACNIASEQANIGSDCTEGSAASASRCALATL
jgi:hypothetical protein